MKKSFTIFGHRVSIKPAIDQPRQRVKRIDRYPLITDRTEQRLHVLLCDHYRRIFGENNKLKFSPEIRIARLLNLTREEVKSVVAGATTPNYLRIREYISKELGVTIESVFPLIRHIDTHKVRH